MFAKKDTTCVNLITAIFEYIIKSHYYKISKECNENHIYSLFPRNILFLGYSICLKEVSSIIFCLPSRMHNKIAASRVSQKAQLVFCMFIFFVFAM